MAAYKLQYRSGKTEIIFGKSIDKAMKSYDLIRMKPYIEHYIELPSIQVLSNQLRSSELPSSQVEEDNLGKKKKKTYRPNVVTPLVDKSKYKKFALYWATENKPEIIEGENIGHAMSLAGYVKKDLVFLDSWDNLDKEIERQPVLVTGSLPFTSLA